MNWFCRFFFRLKWNSCHVVPKKNHHVWLRNFYFMLSFQLYYYVLQNIIKTRRCRAPSLSQKCDYLIVPLRHFSIYYLFLTNRENRYRHGPKFVRYRKFHKYLFLFQVITTVEKNKVVCTGRLVLEVNTTTSITYYTTRRRAGVCLIVKVSFKLSLKFLKILT